MALFVLFPTFDNALEKICCCEKSLSILEAASILSLSLLEVESMTQLLRVISKKVVCSILKQQYDKLKLLLVLEVLVPIFDSAVELI